MKHNKDDRRSENLSPWAEWVRRKPILSSSSTDKSHDEEDPELHTLRQLLAKCPISVDKLPKVLNGLVRPPLILGQGLAPDPESLKDAIIEMGVEKGKPCLVRRKRIFDRETAEVFKRLDTNPSGSKRARYMRAYRSWKSTGEPHGLSVSQQGRTPEIDSALVFYCYRLLLDAAGVAKSKLADRTAGGRLTQAIRCGPF